MRLSALNEALRDDLNSTTNMICDKIEERNIQITSELIKMNENLTEQIYEQQWGIEMWRYMGLETCSLPGYDRPQHQLSLWLEYDWILQENLW